MKLTLVVFVLSLIMGSTSAAQGVFDRDIPTKQYTYATPVGEILTELAREFEFKIEPIGQPPLETTTFFGQLPRATLRYTINHLMPLVRSNAVFRADNVVEIYGPGRIPPAEALERNTRVIPRTSPRADLPSTDSHYPETTLPYPSHEIAERPVTGSILSYMPGPSRVVPIDAPLRSSYPWGVTSSGYRGGSATYSGWYGDREALYHQRMIDIGSWGALRFKKGREKVMENIEVWGCGQLLAQADEANNIWDNLVFVPVNCSPLQFRYTAGKVDWEVEIPVMIVPIRIQRSKNITLDEEFFLRARVITQRTKYTMVEMPDGSFRKVPRQ